MKSRAILLVTGWLMIVTVPGAVAVPAPIFCKPALGPTTVATASPAPAADSRGYDVLRYDLVLRLDPGARALSGQVGIRYRAESDLAELRLDLVPELAVTAVDDSYGPLPFTHSDELLTVRRRDTLPAGDRDSLTVAWSGRPPRHGSFNAGLMFRTHDAGTPDDPGDDVPIIANVSETWSAHSWWPCKDHPSDKALVSLEVTVPDSLAAVSNGTLLAVAPAEPGWRRFRWRERYPLPTYLVSVAVSDYASWSEDCHPTSGPDVRLDFHAFRSDRARVLHDLADSCEMMSFLTGLLGPWPYPDEKYAQVEIKWIGAMEHTTATSISQFLFTGESTYETIFVHELVHQWFGDSLTPATWPDVWLNEGFARYGEALWLEHRDGPAAYDAFMRQIGPTSHPDLFRGEGLLSDPDPILPNTLVYDKGAWVLHMLRGLLGDDSFFAFWRAYATDPDLVHANVTVADMIAVAESVAGTSLDGFFTPWLGTDRTPVVSDEWILAPGGAVTLTLSQHQSPVFQLPVPVVLHTACGDQIVTARLTRRRQQFQWSSACAVDSVSIAPDGMALLRRLDSAPPPLDAFGPHPNPSSAAGTDFDLFLMKSSQIVVNTYDAMGRRQRSQPLGQLAATGPRELAASLGHPWHWTATDAADHALPSGVYYLEFQGGGNRQVKQVTLVR